MPLDLSYNSCWTESPEHSTEGVRDSAETGNNHWEEVVKVIKAERWSRATAPISSAEGVTPSGTSSQFRC